VLIIATVVLAGVHGLLAQSSGELKWLRVGSLHAYISEQNEEIESGGTANNSLNITMSWPAQYSLEQGTMRSRNMWLGCTNFNDEKAGKVYAYKVVGVGPRDNDDLRKEVFLPPAEFKLIGKFDHPVVVVDGELATINTFYDVLDGVDENLPADRMIAVKNHTYIGVTVTKKVYAFSQQNHGNYFVFDYVLKNTGITSPSGEITPRTLTGFIFYLGYRYSFAGESVRGFDPSLRWGSWNASWGRSTVNDVVGTDPNATDFEFRAHFAWYGPDSGRPLSLEDDWGLPNQLDDGVMAAAKFGGAVVLHADKSPDDPSDDLFQPRTTHYIDTDLPFLFPPYYSFDERFTTQRYELMALGHAAQSQAKQIEQSGTPANEWGPGIGGSAAAQGFGPYTLEPGDSVHIVLAQAVAGISREKNREVGGNWLQYYKGNRTAELRMPDGSVTTDHTAYKKAWVWTGKDSLFKSFRNALSNYGAGYAIPQPPPPPAQFSVASGGDRISLSWAENATTAPHFNGYVIYRSEGSVLDVKTVYKKIFECNASNVVHSFDDVTAARGFDYYYYIQSKDDGTQNDVEPGRPLYSSMFWTVTNKAARLLRPAAPETPVPPDADTTFFKPKPPEVAWALGSNYRIYDVVTYNGLTYVCTKSVTGDTTRPDLGKALWKLAVNRGEWIPGSAYRAFEFVTYSGLSYVVKYDISAGKGLELVRVVPNPYDIRSRLFQFGDQFQYDRIAFFGLPPVAKLKIFTERGDLIWEKEHDNGAGDEVWDSTTSSGQIITSGIYILYVEAPGRGSVYRKFVVIR
jgi:hypothetical protein